MGRNLHIDPFAGAAGDMYVAMLLDLGGDFAYLQHELNKLPLQGEYRLTAEKTQRLGLSGTYFKVHLAHEHAHEHSGAQAHAHDHGHNHSHDSAHSHEHTHSHSHPHSHDGDHAHSHSPKLMPRRKATRSGATGHTHSHTHSHSHAHSHEHGHPHEQGHGHTHEHAPGRPHSHDPARAWRAIRGMIESSRLTAGVKARALAAFEALAISEARQHGVAVDDVTFHEVGAVDSIVDMVGAAILLNQLDVTEITCGPIATGGGGYVDCDHGRFPVPAPATLELLRGLPLRATDIPLEMCTPTGAALLKAWSTHFGAQPAMTVERIGYGAGTRAHSRGIPNLLRGMLGQRSAAAGESHRIHNFSGDRDRVVELEANIDDMTAEGLALALERLLAAGALDTQVLPATMKKSRPGHLLRVLCDPAQETALATAMLTHTTTFGVRVQEKERYKLQREFRSVATAFGPVRIKIGLLGDQPLHFVPEYEDVRAAALAHQVTFETAHAAALAAFDAPEPGPADQPAKKITDKPTHSSARKAAGGKKKAGRGKR